MSDATTGRLTTHVLDTALGRPAAGVGLTVSRLDGAARAPLVAATTNADGRTDAPLLAGSAFAPGLYEIVFRAGDYHRAVHGLNGAPLFLEEIPLRFGVSEAGAHYHVPLLLSPFGYSTYRGS